MQHNHNPTPIFLSSQVAYQKKNGDRADKNANYFDLFFR